MSRLRVVIVSGSSSRPSRTRLLAEQILAVVGREVEIEPHVIDIADVGSDLGRALVRHQLSASAERALALVESAEILIAATPVHRGSYSGHFKHLFDLIDQDALIDVPVILAATGGGDRHCLVIEHMLRPLFSFLQAFAVPVGIYATPADFTEGVVSSEIVRTRIAAASRQAVQLARSRGPGAQPQPQLSASPAASASRHSPSLHQASGTSVGRRADESKFQSST
jgi:FMN reductase